MTRRSLHFSCQTQNSYFTFKTTSIAWFDFSERTENGEKKTFDAVKALMSKLPSSDGDKKGINGNTDLKSCFNPQQRMMS